MGKQYTGLNKASGNTLTPGPSCHLVRFTNWAFSQTRPMEMVSTRRFLKCVGDTETHGGFCAEKANKHLKELIKSKNTCSFFLLQHTGDAANIPSWLQDRKISNHVIYQLSDFIGSQGAPLCSPRCSLKCPKEKGGVWLDLALSHL